MGALRRFVSSLLILAVRFYQAVIAPLLIGSCKFCPSCSEYFIEAVELYGPLRGGWLGAKRLLRCHPFGPGGIDPVPAPTNARQDRDRP
jgi:putative membrane protein insertion efficiency factor